MPNLTLSTITIRRFMDAMFNGHKADIDNWEELFTAYIDASGQVNQRQYSLMVQKHNLCTRLNAINAFIQLQTDFFNHFEQPLELYIKDGVEVRPFDDVKQFGHRITWDASKPDQFAKDLKRMDVKERINIAHLDKVEKDLQELGITGKVKENADARTDFIRQLNMLSQHQHYAIDKDKTDMEELCILIKSYNEEMQAAAERNAKNK